MVVRDTAGAEAIHQTYMIMLAQGLVVNGPTDTSMKLSPDFASAGSQRADESHNIIFATLS